MNAIVSISVAGLAMLAVVAGAAPVNPNDPVAVARMSVEMQTRDWNRGDLDAAMASYCPTPDITWVNAKGVTKGYASFAESMQAEFGPGSAGMGVLRNEVIYSRALGNGSSLLVLEWSIERDGQRVMGGISTQLWSPCEGRLRIVFEHAS